MLHLPYFRRNKNFSEKLETISFACQKTFRAKFKNVNFWSKNYASLSFQAK